MIRADVSGCSTVREFYDKIRAEQELAHGLFYCAQHDAIRKLLENCTSYKELGTHQGATAANAMLYGEKLDYIELIDIDHVLYRNKLQSLAELYCKEKDIELVVKDMDSASVKSVGRKIDLMLIDSVHNGIHCTKELHIHAPMVDKYIVFHDTSVFRNDLYKTITHFLSKYKEWQLLERNTDNVGYTVIGRI